MFALGAIKINAADSENFSEADKQHWLKMGEEIGETCYQSYKRSPNGIGPESFRFTPFKSKDNLKATSRNEKYYLLRPEVIETYFYLWRLTKNQKWRDYGWEAAQNINQHCRAEAGFSGLKDVYAVPPVQDDLQQSFFFAETLKYLYLLFSDDELLDLDDWVFNTEAHPLRIIK